MRVAILQGQEPSHPRWWGPVRNRGLGILPAVLPLQRGFAADREARSLPQGSAVPAESSHLQRENNLEASGWALIPHFWWDFSLASFARVSPPCC